MSSPRGERMRRQGRVDVHPVAVQLGDLGTAGEPATGPSEAQPILPPLTGIVPNRPPVGLPSRPAQTSRRCWTGTCTACHRSPSGRTRTTQDPDGAKEVLSAPRRRSERTVGLGLRFGVGTGELQLHPQGLPGGQHRDPETLRLDGEAGEGVGPGPAEFAKSSDAFEAASGPVLYCQVAVSGSMPWARAPASMHWRNHVARPARMPS